MAYTVGDVAKLAKVSVRTLHHYDEIGLLEPSERSGGGYRLYSGGDLERLQQVLFFKELGFTLDDIRRIMLDPAFDRRSALEAQRALLAEKAARTSAMLAAIDTALDATERGTTMDEKEMFEVFGDFDPAQYEAEVEQRWGGTEAYSESARRTKGYTKADWQRIKAESASITAAYVAAMDAGDAPDSPAVLEVAERHWQSIDENFYSCPLEMFANLADMWVADKRFERNIDKARPGLAEFQRAAAKAWVASGKA